MRRERGTLIHTQKGCIQRSLHLANHQEDKGPDGKFTEDNTRSPHVCRSFLLGES